MARVEQLKAILARISGLESISEPLPQKEYEQLKADGLNATEGDKHLQDGYHCNTCRDKGFVVKVVEDDDGFFHQTISDCKCVPVRRSIMRMNRSGLKNIITDYTFDKFEAVAPWQKQLKTVAQEYVKNPEGWFFVGGQVGCGKTHICTAICREFLLAGRSVRYMLWRDDIVKLKANVTDSEGYQRLIDDYKNAEVLYIDDLFKTGKSNNGETQKPTSADINIAFEIVNYRYNNPGSITLFSTELTTDELVDIDEAVGSRIYERSKAITVGRNRQKNYRLKNQQALADGGSLGEEDKEGE